MKDFFHMGTGVAFFIALVVAYYIGPKMLPFLTRLKQTVREDGPSTHLNKNGTPTMGGLIFILSTLVAVSILAIIGRGSGELVVALVFMILFGLVGFIDDYIKVVLKRSLGLRAYQKIILQVSFALALAIYQKHTSTMGTVLRIPFFPKQGMDIGMLYIPFITLVIVAVVNSVNLTDGLDGLAGGVTFFVALFLAFGGLYLGYGYLAIFMGATAGGCMGFLRVNRHPAKVFMGDVGSMALGGAIAAGAVIADLTLFIPLVGFIYFAESLSVILQVVSFKMTGKRIFKMAPLHHHFELSGWAETKVVKIFYISTFVLCMVGLFAL